MIGYDVVLAAIAATEAKIHAFHSTPGPWARDGLSHVERGNVGTLWRVGQGDPVVGVRDVSVWTNTRDDADAIVALHNAAEPLLAGWRATVERHSPVGIGWCARCASPMERWPCTEVTTIITALRALGTLPPEDT